jgi:hypothetical protein
MLRGAVDAEVTVLPSFPHATNGIVAVKHINTFSTGQVFFSLPQL